MNPLKKGPELKLPDVKVPDFLLDLYYDLRERRLLPLVAILLVAIVALPIALSGSSNPEPEGGSGESATLSTVAAPPSELVVAKAAPGLRDYHRRLPDQAPKDPFVQQYTGSESGVEGETSGGGESAPSGTESVTATLEPAAGETPSTPTETTGTTTPGGEGDEATHPGNPEYFSFVADVRIVPVSSGAAASKASPLVRRGLPELTMLPSHKTPALTFMGVTKDGKKALMLVSDKVTGLFGDGICAVGSEACQLLSLEPGIPETVVYGDQEQTFRIELLKLHLRTTKHLNTAPLGASKHNKKSAKHKGAAAPTSSRQPR